ncbi:unnamed protein product [Enterobius vermicularis]|uniref:Ubiquitin-like domain-containing protein n=1 Tax=Enterobius vermicularis TaxID=51028 RepID=A0A0N4V8R4_ENTVE|nr:unnamed protein product [Enterobius vermicularis]
MVDNGSDEETQQEIQIKVKTTTESYEIKVPEKSRIEKVKAILSQKINQPVEKLCLIFSGKILKDHETIEQHSIKDGMAIHLVIRQHQKPATSGFSGSSSSVGSTGTGGNNSTQNPFAPMMGGAGNPMGIAQQMVQNPEMIRQFMNSPIMQSLMSNPEIFRHFVAENPQMQQIIEANPELGHMLNDPDLIRQTLEMVRNPTMFQEMMRNHDRAGIPGGQAALQRLYQDIQEPLLNSATSSLAGNPFASLVDNSGNTTSRSQRAGVENAEALPNPWGPANRNTQTSTNGTSNGTENRTSQGEESELFF